MSLLVCTCGRRIVTKAEWAGKRVRCPSCAAVLSVPPGAGDDPGAEPVTPCPHCKELVRVGAYRCPKCGKPLTSPVSPAPELPTLKEIGPGQDPPGGGPEVVTVPATMVCPFCRETIQSGAVKCRFCGEFLERRRRPVEDRPRPPSVDSGGVGVLVCALLGWLLCGLLHPVAWYMGSSYEQSCRAQGLQPSSAGQAGRIMGMIGSILLGFGILLFVVLLGAGAFSGPCGPSR